MAFQAMNRSILKAGGASTCAVFLSSSTTWFSERQTIKTVDGLMQHGSRRLYHHLANLQQRSPLQQYMSTTNPANNRFFSTTNTTIKEAAAKKIAEDAANPASALKPKMSFMEWYEGHLERSPLLTKMITGSILWSVGDATAQIVPHFAASDATSSKPLNYDWMRTGRATIFGFFIHAPASHLHFNFLESLTQKVGVTGLRIPVFKTIMEQFVYWSWVSNSMYHGFMGLMQGMTLTQIYKRIEDVLWETQKAQWAFWIPVQLLNFQFIPVRHQLNVVLVTSIVWTALLSAWYPPVDDEEESNKEDDTKKVVEDTPVAAM